MQRVFFTVIQYVYQWTPEHPVRVTNETCRHNVQQARYVALHQTSGNRFAQHFIEVF